MKAADVRRSARRVEVARVLLLCAFGGLSLRRMPIHKSVWFAVSAAE